MEFLLPLAPFIDLGSEAALSAFAVFTRVAGAVSLLPGFGETSLSPRLKLAAALAFTLVVFPMVATPGGLAAMGVAAYGLILMAEALAGMILGVSVRLTLMALQTAGTIASQSVAVTQMFGGAMSVESQPAYSNVLAVGGVALAFALGLPAYAAAAMVESYAAIPFGSFPLGADFVDWGVSRVAAAFASAVGLAAPFILAAFAYNIALGAINRAMPQLMGAFVGAPAITAGAIMLMALATPLMMQVWGDGFLGVISNPYGR